jgi:integrase
MTKNRKQNLTDRTLKALKPAKLGERYEILDATQPSLAIRVTSGGAMTFVLRSRFPGSPHFTRKALGAYPTLSLGEARERAREWLQLIAKGIDPEVEAERARQEELRKQKHTFASVAEQYIAEVVIGPDPDDPLQRQARKTAQYIRSALVTRWGERPIADIDDVEVTAFLRERRGTPAHARNLLVKLRSLFSWAIETRSYGLKASPCDHIKINKLIGEPKTRDRTLTEDELRAFWKCTAGLGYPAGPLYQLLLLSGLRLNEVARASWDEIDLVKREWLVPKDRMKGRKHKARPHLVPLTSDMVVILENLPRFDGGGFVFTTTFGVKPVAFGNKIKRRLDRAMLSELREAAKLRGNKNPEKVKLAPWVNHDLRRTMRTGLSSLKISREIAEATLAHARPSLVGVYDLYDFKQEKLQALEAWGAKLRGIVEPDEPKPQNVVKLRPAMAVS